MTRPSPTITRAPVNSRTAGNGGGGIRRLSSHTTRDARQQREPPRAQRSTAGPGFCRSIESCTRPWIDELDPRIREVADIPRRQHHAARHGRSPRSGASTARLDARQRAERPRSPHRRAPPRCRTEGPDPRADHGRRGRQPRRYSGGVCPRAGTRCRCVPPLPSLPSRTAPASGGHPASRARLRAGHRASVRKRRWYPARPSPPPQSNRGGSLIGSRGGISSSTSPRGLNSS